MESWEGSGWHIDLLDDDTWVANKTFEGEEIACTLEGHGSLITLLTEVEKQEANRKTSDESVAETVVNGSSTFHVAPKILIKSVRCDMTDDDVAQRTRLMIDTMNDLDNQQTRFEEQKSEHKAAVKMMNLTVQKARHAIHSKSEFRDIACRERFRWENFTVEVVRCDNDEVVESRTMTDKERQLYLYRDN